MMSSSVVSLVNACLEYDERVVWDQLNIEVEAGEFVVVLGPNGSGKTSLLKVLLGLESLTSGEVTVLGHPPAHGNQQIAYVPQQKSFDPDLPIRGRDLVRFGLDGHLFGFGFGQPTAVDRAIKSVDGEAFADKPIGRLSGGEQQRLRIAQALLGNPKLLLCDEPLLSLDLSQQAVVSGLIDQRRREKNTAVLFVTHDINPVLPMADRVLYLVHGHWAVGRPEEVLTSQSLSTLYGSLVEVATVNGRIIVLGADEAVHTEVGHSHHHGREMHHG